MSLEIDFELGELKERIGRLKRRERRDDQRGGR